MKGLAKIVALGFTGALLLGCPAKKEYTDPYNPNPQTYSKVKRTNDEVVIAAEDQTLADRAFGKDPYNNRPPTCMPMHRDVAKIKKVEKDSLIIYRVNTNPKKIVKQFRIFLDNTRLNKGDDPYAGDWKFIEYKPDGSPGSFCYAIPKRFLPLLTKGKHVLKAELEYVDGTRASDLIKLVVE